MTKSDVVIGADAIDRQVALSATEGAVEQPTQPGTGHLYALRFGEADRVPIVRPTGQIGSPSVLGYRSPMTYEATTPGAEADT